MACLPITQIPSLRQGEPSHLAEQQGFVDEALVTRLLATAGHSRAVARHQDLALAADDSDFAGWQHAPCPPPPQISTPERTAEIASEEVPQIPLQLGIRRATPPKILPSTPNTLPRRSGLQRTAPRRTRHAAWIAALIGVIFSSAIALAFLHHSDQWPLFNRSAPQAPSFHPAITRGD